MKRAIILICALTLIFMFMSFGLLQSGQNKEDTKFEKALNSFLDEMWKFYPTAGTMAGYHKYNNKLENLSENSLLRRREALDEINQQLVAEVDKFKLSPGVQIDHEIIIDAIDKEIINHDMLMPWEYDPIYYNEIILNSIRGIIKNESTSIGDRLNNIEARLKEFPKFIKRAKGSLKNPPKIYTETAIKQFIEIMKFFREELPTYYNQVPAITSKIQAAASKAITALGDYQNFLQNELLTRSDENFRVGPQAHKRLVRIKFKNSIPYNELVARAKADLNNTRREMFLVCIPYYSIMYSQRKLDQMGQVTEEQLRNIGIKGVFDKVKGEHVSKDEFLDKVKATVEEIKNIINDSQFFDLPSDNLTIETMPEIERCLSYTRLVTPRAYENSNKYTFLVNPIPNDWDQERIESYLDEYNNFFIYFWTLRKVYPGMFIPFYQTQKNSTLVRRLYPNMPLLKGWPVYLEEKLVQAGLGNWNLFLRLNQLKFYLRAVIDFLLEFNIHEGSMTKEQAFDLMIKMGFQTQAEAERKWNHIIHNPLDAAYTYVGLQEIIDMEKEYKKLKGNGFNQKEFRSKLFSFGAIPIRLLKELMLK